jgi:hypothetical protein
MDIMLSCVIVGIELMIYVKNNRIRTAYFTSDGYFRVGWFRYKCYSSWVFEEHSMRYTSRYRGTAFLSYSPLYMCNSRENDRILIGVLEKLMN